MVFKSCISLKSEDLLLFQIIKEYIENPENNPEKYSKNVLRNVIITYCVLDDSLKRMHLWMYKSSVF